MLESYRRDDSDERSQHRNRLKKKLGLDVTRNTCVTCPGSFRKLAKGNNSKNNDARAMDPVHDTSSHLWLYIYEVSIQ